MKKQIISDQSLFIIIPVHNRKQLTINCLRCLERQTEKRFQIVVIDDGSNDGTSEAISEEFPDVHLINGDGTLWWAEATNVGVKYAIQKKADYVITLNDDTEPPADFISKMMEAVSIKPNALIGSSAVEKSTNELVFIGANIDWGYAKYNQVPINTSIRNRNSGFVSVTHFPGRGLLVPVSVFQNIGFFDSKNFPQTLADFDFTHRAKEYGYEIFCNIDVKLVIYSELSSTVKLRRKKTFRNFCKHLFSLQGGSNIQRFIKYAKKNCPRKYKLQFIIIGVVRRIFGYWK